LSENQRVAQRVRTLRPAKVVWDDSRQAANCVIKDLSDTGAAIELKEIAAIPASFNLMMLPSKEMRPAEIVRRNGQNLGIVFLDTYLKATGNDGDAPQAAMETYNVITGLNPMFGPVPEKTRRLFPWAS